MATVATKLISIYAAGKTKGWMGCAFTSLECSNQTGRETAFTMQRTRGLLLLSLLCFAEYFHLKWVLLGAPAHHVTHTCTLKDEILLVYRINLTIYCSFFMFAVCATAFRVFLLNFGSCVRRSFAVHSPFGRFSRYRVVGNMNVQFSI